MPLKEKEIERLESIYRPIENDLAKVEAILSGITEEVDPFLSKALKSALSQKGKRLRPALLILSSMLGDNRIDVSAPAAAVELVHAAALLHDDVVDHADMRRGALTASKELGKSMSIVLGNYLYSKAFELIPGTDGLRRQLSSATVSMCSGEAAELTRRGDLGITLGDYVQMAGKKTASLISACCAIGGLLGKADSAVCALLGGYGLLLGLAFQIKDDCLDLTGEGDTTGKGSRRDFTEKNATLPLILSLPHFGIRERRRIKAIFEGGQETDTDWLAQTVEKYQGIEKALGLASEFSKRAAKNLETIADCQAKTCLLLIADYSVQRDS
jgi:octaprenyl-diphosphate synthase